jgi:hypothetical protein
MVLEIAPASNMIQLLARLSRVSTIIQIEEADSSLNISVAHFVPFQYPLE